ncbi:sugar nucleotide-binding protein [Oceanobacter mangrovi]|uniref:sugar nucleotide-binding protein n=1 Tax=Oceanobacter mangrovi TaxID=2862510 RepID=UPI001C8D1055|nr:sugar nucleotide-binding protein [Oceanobacter mangrovi]
MPINPFYSFVIGADRPVGQHLARVLAQENYLYKGLGIESQERFAMHSGGQPFFVLTPSIFNSADWTEIDAWAERAEEYDAPLVLVSSLAVFQPAADHRYSEQESSFADTPIAQVLLAAEERVRKLRRHIILRIGQPFSVQAGDFAHQLLTTLRQQQHLLLDDGETFSPTPEDDVAAVLLAILKQADCTDELWGTYHFNGVEPVTAYAFAEALLSEASQFEDFSEARLESTEQGSKPLVMVPDADVSRLFHTFGIKRKPWRAGLGRLVRSYYRVEKKEA